MTSSCEPCAPSQAGESVLSALGGCKLLRELSKLESETENKLAMKELAQTFENLAHGESDHELHQLQADGTEVWTRSHM